MKTITPFFLLLFCVLNLNAQISHFEDFEGYSNITEVDWTTTGFFFDSFSRPCDGTSIRNNIHQYSQSGQLISPNFSGLSDGTDIRISFDYKLLNWGFLNATQPGWGEILIQYSINNGNSWIDIDAINDSNHTPSTSCATQLYLVNGSEVPSGSDFRIRFVINWNSGDYYVYMDNISISQNFNLINLTPENASRNLTHCYENLDNTCWVINSEDGSAINVNFNEGTLENCCDTITIYDGADATAPILYQGNNGGNLSGLQFTGTSDKMFIKINSNEAVSCSTNEGVQWNFTVNRPLSVGENNLNQFKFHPNPATNRIDFTTTHNIDQILIYDLLGKQVKNASVDFNTGTIDVNKLASGAYIMRVTAGSLNKNYKFIKL
jgi:hypothetical protein